MCIVVIENIAYHKKDNIKSKNKFNKKNASIRLKSRSLSSSDQVPPWGIQQATMLSLLLDSILSCYSNIVLYNVDYLK